MSIGKPVKTITYTFPDAEIIRADKINFGKLPVLHPNTKQLDIASSTASFTEAEIRNLTHLRVQDATCNQAFHDGLEYLFVCNQSDNKWPMHKNLYVNAVTLKRYLKHNEQKRVYVYDYTNSRKLLIPDDFTDKYTIRNKFEVKAFGNTYPCWELTRIKRQDQAKKTRFQ